MTRLVGRGWTTWRRAAIAAVTMSILAAGAASAQSGVVSREEALSEVFPGAAIDADRVYLTDAQADRIADLARGDLVTKIIARYVATEGGTVVGRAYVDTHVVRTKRASLLISLEADGRVRRIDVTAFLEPPEYIPSERWRNQYLEKPLDDDLAIQRAIRPIAGATLTTRSVNEAVRRILALDRVLQAGSDAGSGEAAP
ncbi:MAG: FMN-binding protein [Acidobacteria bacterium]|nr:FMN-binding protein [Acidobacteriota bacterium]